MGPGRGVGRRPSPLGRRCRLLPAPAARGQAMTCRFQPRRWQAVIESAECTLAQVLVGLQCDVSPVRPTDAVWLLLAARCSDTRPGPSLLLSPSPSHPLPFLHLRAGGNHAAGGWLGPAPSQFPGGTRPLRASHLTATSVPPRCT